MVKLPVIKALYQLIGDFTDRLFGYQLLERMGDGNDCIEVKMFRGKTYIYLNGFPMSQFSKSLWTNYYWDLITLALFVHENPQTMLMLGVGTGVSLRPVIHFFPHIQVTGVDKSEKAVNLGRKYFELSNLEAQNLKIEICNAHEFLQRNHQRFDVVVVDIFGGPYVPNDVLTAEFWKHVTEHLTEKGVVYCNLIELNLQQKENNDCFVERMRTIIPHGYSIKHFNNREFIGTKNELDIKKIVNTTSNETKQANELLAPLEKIVKEF